MRKSRSPILITGSHRSGTTWVGRTISQHQRVRYVQEPFNVDYPNNGMGLKLDTWFTYAESSSHKNEIITGFNNLLQQRPIKYALATCRSAGMDIKTPLRFSKHLMLEHLLSPRILVKDPIALLSAGWLHETYNFKVICMIRNPLAFIGSLKVTGWDFDFENFRKQDGLMTGWLNKFSDSIESMCMKENTSDFLDRAILLWNILHFVILKYQKKYPNWLFIKHEDISGSPNIGFQEIFNYLELDMNANIQNYIDKYTSQNNPIEVTTSYQPRNAKLVLHTWKERLSNDEIRRIKASTSKIASQFYETIV
jgi:hypothetical protein